MPDALLGAIQEHARRDPEALALLRGEGRMTRRALLEATAALAATLARLGVGPGDTVGLACGRTPQHILGWLAAWWRGAAFVPLDPELPPARLALMISETRPALVLAPRRRWGALLPLGVDLLDPEALPRAPDRSAPPRVALAPEDLAYIIYTSGSTGVPKGVRVSHSGLEGLLQGQIDAFGLTPRKRAAWGLSPSFDASVSDIGTALRSGAALCILEDRELVPGAALGGALRRMEVTHADLPPRFLSLMDPDEAGPSLEAVVIGGEPCAPEAVRRWGRRVRLINVYGPTEATVCTSLGRCDPEGWDEPLLGQPLDGVTYHVLDHDMTPVDVEDNGELFIEGPCLALGYLARPALDRERFIAWRGRRLYRTGDRVRRRGDGELVFLGRVDRQLKRRGMLIAPEELEAGLEAIEGVAEAAALLAAPPPAAPHRETDASAHGDNAHDSARDNTREVAVRGREASGEAALVAFVVPAPGAALSEVSCRLELARRVPAWMLPDRIIVADALPRTTTGKVNLGELAKSPALREVAQATQKKPTKSDTYHQNSADDLAAPHSDSGDDFASPSEATLARIWARVLGVSSVGRQESFFALGGDSLKALEVVALAEQAGLALTPAHLLRHPTVASAMAAPPVEAQGMDATTLRRWLDRDVAFSLALDDLRAAHAPRADAGHSPPDEPPRADVGHSPPDETPRADAGHSPPDETPRAIDNPAPRHLLLTGATGFLGARLLHGLLASSDARITCLVRADDPRAGLARLQAACARHGLDLDPARVEVACGDLTRARLGLPPDTWDALADEVDTVVHSGATVHLLAPATELEAANVGGTREALRLALEGRPKRLHLASTLSVFVATDQNTGHAREDDALDHTRQVFGGYAQTKWMAEVLARRASDLIPVGVHRLGLVTGDSHSGLGGGGDFLTLFIQGLALLGRVPQSALETLRVDVTPVDFAAAAMTHLILRTAPRTACWHLAAPRGLALSALVSAMRAAGVGLEIVDDAAWEDARVTAGAAGAAWLALCRALPAQERFGRLRTMDLFQATDIHFDTTAAQAALAGTGLTCPVPDGRAAERFVRWAMERS